MILVDTSIWIDYLSGGYAAFSGVLDRNRVLVHPFVVGELALGRLRNREVVMATLGEMSQAMIVSDREVLHYINRHELFGVGIGYVDAHLLTSVRMTLGASLWTRDKRLLSVAERLGLATHFNS